MVDNIGLTILSNQTVGKFLSVHCV